MSDNQKNKKAQLKSQKNEKTSSNTALTNMQPQKPTHKSPMRLHVVSATVLLKLKNAPKTRETKVSTGQASKTYQNKKNSSRYAARIFF